MRWFAPQTHNDRIDASETEETYFARLQVQRLVAYSIIANSIMLVSGPVAILSYDAPNGPQLGYVLLATAIAAILIKVVLRRCLKEHRFSNWLTFAMSVLYLIPAATGTALRPDDEAGRAIVVVGLACSTYCFSRTSLAALQVAQAVASVAAWSFSGREYGIDDFMLFFVAMPGVGFILFESQRSSLSRSFRLQRETDERRRELEAALHQLTTETALRRESQQRLQEQREQLLHVSRLSTMGELVAGIAHELRQPLHATSMFAEALAAVTKLEQPADSKRLQELSERIVGLTQQSASTIRRLQNFVRRGPRVRTEIDLKDVLRDALELTATDVRHTGVRVQQDLHEAACIAEIDPIQIQQVFVNLIRNACDAMHDIALDRRALNISLRASNADEYEMLFADTGCGIAPAFQSRIFDAFASTKANGLGMGLAISRSIIADHGGRIELVPEVTVGATFRVTLPTRSREATKPA